MFPPRSSRWAAGIRQSTCLLHLHPFLPIRNAVPLAGPPQRRQPRSEACIPTFHRCLGFPAACRHSHLSFPVVGPPSLRRRTTKKTAAKKSTKAKKPTAK